MDATALRPAGVSTKMIKNEKGPGCIMPDEFAEAALNKVTSVLCHGHIKHEIPGTICDNLCDIWPHFG